MRVFWDTNILIDFSEFIDLFGDDALELPSDVETAYADELQALDAFIRIWMIRDIRLYISRAQVFDGALSDERRRTREVQLGLVATALECLDLEDRGLMIDRGRAPLGTIPPSVKGLDREVVSEALRLGCDVLMTRDHGILGQSPTLRRLGIAVVPPTGWLDAMASSRQLGVRGCIHGLLVADSHKWAHLDAAKEAAADGHRASGSENLASNA